MPGQNRKFRFLKPAVPVSAGQRRTVRSKEPDCPRLDFDAATMAQRRHGRVPAAEQGRSGPEEARTGCSRARRSSPHKWTARRGDEGRPRRRRGGGGRRRSPTALHGERRGRVRRGIERGEGEDAPHVRNRVTAHRRRRIDGEGGARTATAMGDGEGARV